MPEPTAPTQSPDSAELTSLKKALESAFLKKNWNYVKTIATDILIKKGYHDAGVLEKFLTACLESSPGSNGVKGGIVARVQGTLAGTFDFQKHTEGLPGQVKQPDFVERFFVGIQANEKLSPHYTPKLAHWIYTNRTSYSSETLIKMLAEYFSRGDASKEDLQKAETLYGPETQAGRGISARISIKRDTSPDGGLNEKNAGDRVALEQDSKQGMTKEQLEKRRDILITKYQQDSDDKNTVKELAGVYEQLEDWEKAGEFYGWAYSLSGSADTTLEDKADEMGIKRLERMLSSTLAGIQLQGDDTDGHPEIITLEDQIGKKKIECVQKRVNRNPTDTGGHFDLGKALWEDFQRKNEKDITSSLLLTAISHIQRALKDAKQENEARLLLAKMLSFQGLHRIALEHIEEVLKSAINMDELRKRTLYLKGAILETDQKLGEARKCFEDIYAHDVGFENVSKKVLTSE